MHSSYPGGSAADAKPSTTRVCVVATPRLFADTLARTMSLAGWQVDAVCTSSAELATFEQTLSDSHVAVLVDGAIPAVALGIELIRRRPGQRVVVVGDSTAPAGSGIVQIASSASVVELIREVSKLDGGQSTDRTLTPRHVEILQLVAHGCSTDEVGVKLGIASKTVNNHLSAVYRRLCTRNLTQAVLRAARAGWIDVSVI